MSTTFQPPEPGRPTDAPKTRDEASPVAVFTLLGIASTTAGVALLSVPGGLITLGVLLLALGFAYARGVNG